jgi:radical SAM protein with 4Fe4S-binding SPASM domain
MTGRYFLLFNHKLPLTRYSATRVTQVLRSTRRDTRVPPPVAMTLDAGASAPELSTQPIHVTLTGAVPAQTIAKFVSRGARVNLVTDGLELDAGRAYALIQAGLTHLEVHASEGHRDRVLRNVEKLVAMRDANRKPGPEVTIRADQGAELPAADAPCYVPWYSTFIAADGQVYPCARHAAGGVSVGVSAGFEAAWNGSKMATFRASLRADRAANPVCANCPHDDGALGRVLRWVGRR